MANVKLLDMRNRISEYVDQTKYLKERFVITKHGKQVAALISIEDLRLLEELEDQLDAAAAREAIEAYTRGEEKAYTLDEAKARLGIK